MQARAGSSSTLGSNFTLLVDRQDVEEVDSAAYIGVFEPVDLGGTVHNADTAAAPGSTPPPVGFDPTLRSPALALLATVCLLEGYKWIGALPASDSRFSTLVFSRPGALVFAVLVTALALGLTRGGGELRRSRPHAAVALASVVVMSASVVLTAATNAATKDAVGLADLVLATALVGALVAGERRQRRASARPEVPAADTDLTSLPFASSRSRPDPGVAA
jgi:lysylphosphatidylglycerol synthetase-like protein (DUF2156 family)